MPSKRFTVTVPKGCEICGKDAHVSFKQDQTGQGTMLRPIKQRVWCDTKCLGGGVLTDETIQDLAERYS